MKKKIGVLGCGRRTGAGVMEAFLWTWRTLDAAQQEVPCRPELSSGAALALRVVALACQPRQGKVRTLALGWVAESSEQGWKAYRKGHAANVIRP